VSRRLLLLTVTLVAAALAGCGAAGDSSGDFAGEEARVADAVEALQEAATDRDERRICRALLAPQVAQRLGDCERQIAGVLDQSDSYELAVEDVRLVGRDRARARVQSGGDEDADRTIDLVRVQDDWRIAELGDPPPAQRRS